MVDLGLHVYLLLVPEFMTTQEGIDPYICAEDPDGEGLMKKLNLCFVLCVFMM